MKKIVGAFLVVFSLVILVATYFPLVKNEVNYQIIKSQGQKAEEAKPLYPDFGIVIPKLGINAKVIKNVNPYDSKIYQVALTKGVAHAQGTALPGEKGNTFIFSHSSESFYEAIKYNSIFYLLTKLEIGDTISVYFESNRYDYQVSEKKVIESSDTKYLTAKSDKTMLTLMTCYPPGTNLKRFIVVAK
jgi:sortase A